MIILDQEILLVETITYNSRALMLYHQESITNFADIHNT